MVKTDGYILLATQQNASDDDPSTEAIYKIGALASVLQLLKLPDGTVKVLVEGAARAEINEYVKTDDFYAAKVEDRRRDRMRIRSRSRRWRARSFPSSRTTSS